MAEYKNVWKPTPLNRTGNLSAWQRKMYAACPNPSVGEVVFLTTEHYDQAEGINMLNRTGYKCLNFKANGEPIWQRGMTVSVPVDTVH
jgi:hypothetical protein